MKTTEANELRRIRVDTLGWTQEKMANWLGASLRTYSRYEAGRPPSAIIRLAQYAKPSQPAKEPANRMAGTVDPVEGMDRMVN
jgi:DNA-binding XRE family transcriptional regulator